MEQRNTVQESFSFCGDGTASGEFGYLFDYHGGASEKEFDFSEEFGRGRFTRRTINPFTELWTTDLNPCHMFEMTGICRGNFYCLSFCLSDGMEWEERISRKRFRIGRGYGLFYHIRDIDEVCACYSGQRLRCLSLMFHPDRFENLLPDLSAGGSLFQHVHSNFKLSFFNFPRGSAYIIKQLLACPYGGSIGALYREGKVAELLALSLHGISMKEFIPESEIKLTKTDTAGLREVKEILDESLSAPVCIKKLACRAGLNEYKLKKGFKQLYGTPVYTYLIEKRMQKARELLEEGSGTVSEIAEYVGYSCQSSFSKAFKKKYGFNPRDCF